MELFKRLLLVLAVVIPCGLFSLTPKEALARLVEGNERYATDKLLHPDRTQDRREETVSTQEPFAVILGCSDSRVAPEILFDQGIGDLFPVRVAGNVVGPIELESIEYGVFHLHASMILVLGHQNCGAVNAVLQGQTEGVDTIAQLIAPAVQKGKEELKKKEFSEKNLLENCIQINARMIAESLKRNPELKKLIDQGKLAIMPAYYDLLTGKVNILD